jgi:tetratricopeptide (TPR) repeat protein
MSSTASPRRPRVATAVAVALALLALALGACGDSADQAAKYTERGKALYAAGELAKAGVEFRNALQIEPKAVEPRYFLALMEERQGNFASAFRLLQAVAADKPDHVAAQAKLGQFYVAQGDLEKAQDHAVLAAGLDPRHPELLLLEGTLAYRSRDFATAAERADAVLQAAPDNVGAAILKSRALKEAGRTEEALAALDQAAARLPKDPTLRLAKVQMLLADQRTDDAIQVYRDLVDAQPDDYNHRRVLAALYTGSGRPADAEAVFRQAIAAKVGGHQPKLALVELVAREKGRDAAEAELLKLVEAEPGEPALRLRLADLYLTGDKQALGQDMLEQIVTADDKGPHGAAARIGLARFHLSRNDRARAEALVAEVLDRDPANADALFLRAGLALGTGDASAAITDLRTVLRDRPSSKPALEMLERAYTASKQPELAEETLARVAELDPRDPKPVQRLAMMKAQRGEKEEARALLDEVLKKDAGAGSDAAAASLQAKAALLLSEQKWDEAEHTLKLLAALPQWKPRALVLTGIMAMARNQPDDAVTAFEQAHGLAPDSPEPVSALVRLQLMRGKGDNAVAFLQRAVAARPDNPVFHNFLGEVQITRGQRAAAEAALDRARTLRPTWAVPYVNLGRLHTAAGDLDKALAAIAAGLDKIPNQPLLLMARGETEDRLDRHDAAIATFLAVAEADPRNLAAANNAAALIADHAFTDAALMKRAEAMAARLEGTDNPAFLDTRGWVLYRSGALVQARDLLQRAVTALPDSPQLAYHYGMVLARLGETAKARELLAKAVTGDARYPGLEEAKATLATLGG